VRRQQEIIAQQAVTMRQLTAAPQEPAQDAQTVEGEPEGSEPPLVGFRARLSWF